MPEDRDITVKVRGCSCEEMDSLSLDRKKSGRELVSGLIRLLGEGGLLWNRTFASSCTGGKR